LLINIIAGAALVSLSTIAVDILAVYILPQKKHYGDYKYEPTPQFDGLILFFLFFPFILMNCCDKKKNNLELDTASNKSGNS